MYNTKVINFLGGPGAGKTLMAAFTFGKMKLSNFSEKPQPCWKFKEFSIIVANTKPIKSKTFNWYLFYKVK